MTCISGILRAQFGIRLFNAGKRCVLFVIVLIGLSTVPISRTQAQGAEVGAMRGQVVDADFSVPLPGVSLVVEPGGRRIDSDDDGIFFVNELAPGIYTVNATASGYIRSVKRDVVVNVGRVTELSLQMTAEVVELDEFIVQAIDTEEVANVTLEIGAPLQAFASAVAPALLKASGSSGDIGSAVGRLAATAVVDSRYVVIRGLSDRYNAVVLNGARLPSSDPDRRAVNIDIFPAGLVETIVSSKTFVPWLPGESTGGYLNVVTKQIPDGPFAKVSISSAYNTNTTGRSDFLAYRGSGVGFLGTARDRAIPDVLSALSANDLPFQTATRTYFDPARTTPLVAQQADISSKRFSDNRLAAATSLVGRGMGVSTVTAPANFSFSALAGTRVENFLGGDLGLLGGVTYGKSYKMSEGIQGSATIGSDSSGQNVTIPRTRFVFSRGEESLLAGLLLGAAIEWDRDKVSLNYFTNIAAEDQAIFNYGESEIFSTIDNGIPVEQEQELLYREFLYYTERKLQTLQLIGEHDLGDTDRIKIDWAAAYSMSYQDQPDLRKNAYAYSFRTNQYINAGDPSPPNFERIWRRLDDTNYNLVLNVEVPLDDSKSADDSYAKLKVGGSMDYSTRDYLARNYQYEVLALALFPTFSTPSADDAVSITIADSLEQVDLTDRSSRPAAGGRQRVTDSIFLTQGKDTAALEAYTATQSIPAAYGAVNYMLSDEFEVTAGARVEATNIDFSVGTDFGALDPTSNAALVLSDPITGEPYPQDELTNPGIVRTDLLPALSTNWALRDDMNLRSSIARTIARPTFKEVAPVISRDPESGQLYVGYVLLDMSAITNYDVRWEWNFDDSDIIALSFFAKQIDKPIELVNTGQFFTTRNELSASVYGFEIEMNKSLDDVMEVLRDLTFTLNYGFVFSKASLSEFSREAREVAGLSAERPLQGQPEYTFNAALTYDNEDFGVSAGLLLNVTGPLLYAVGGRAGSLLAPDVIQQAYTNVDCYLSKKLIGEWDLSIRAINLLNEPRQIEFTGGVPFSVLRSGIVYTVGISGKW